MYRLLLIALLMSAQPALANNWALRPSLDAQADWSGAHFGAFGGAAVSNGKADIGDFWGSLIPLDVEYGLFPQSIDGNTAGILGGVSVGFNVQSGNIVWGVEGDIGYADANIAHDYSRIDNVPTSPFPGVSTNTRYETEFGTIGTLRLRGGYAFGNSLLFASAGLAAGQVRNRFELALPEIGYQSPDWSSSGTKLGYTLGMGFEQKLTNRFTAKLEMLFINLDDDEIAGTDPNAFPGEMIEYKFKNDLLLPRLGFSVGF